MKSRVKCEIIDLMLAGVDVHVRYNPHLDCWSLMGGSLIRGDQRWLFNWNWSKVPNLDALAAEPLTLQKALALVDDNWADRRILESWRSA